MSARAPDPHGREATAPARVLAEQTFSRVAGAPLVPGNRVRLLRDAAENYPAWLDAMGTAERTIHLESYIVHEDETGERFADLLGARAEAGVRVRLLYDWLGGLGHASRRFWRRLRARGVEVRCFNPPRVASPLGWVRRDHRKLITVDGRIGFVTGLCVGRRWVGDPAHGIDPWRDTGIELQGPAVADLEQAFAQTRALTGPPVPEDDLVPRDAIPPAGEVALRVIATVPSTGQLNRLDQLIAAGARRLLWLTDAYFVGRGRCPLRRPPVGRAKATAGCSTRSTRQEAITGDLLDIVTGFEAFGPAGGPGART